MSVAPCQIGMRVRTQEIKSRYNMRRIPDSLFKWAVLHSENRTLLDILVVVVINNFHFLAPASAKIGLTKCIPKPGPKKSDFGRGITKGNLCGKLPTAILARRLGAVISAFDLLGPDSHAYLAGRNAHDAIRKWVMLWNSAKADRTPS